MVVHPADCLVCGKRHTVTSPAEPLLHKLAEIERGLDAAARLKRRTELALGIAIGFAILGWLR